MDGVDQFGKRQNFESLKDRNGLLWFFWIIQDLIISATPEFIRALRATGDAGKPISVYGTLHYQACDDKKCFVPETVAFYGF